MNKYRVGDKVLIKDLEWYHEHKNTDGTITVEDDENFINSFVSGMTQYCGKEAIISMVDPEWDCYRLDIDNGFWQWSSFMFDEEGMEAIEEKKKKEELQANQNLMERFDALEILKKVDTFGSLTSEIQGALKKLHKTLSYDEKLVLEEVFGRKNFIPENTWQDFENRYPDYEWNPRTAYVDRIIVLKKTQLLIENFYGGIPKGNELTIARITKHKDIERVVVDDNYVPGVFDFKFTKDAERFLKYNEHLIDMYYA